ncbi:MAG: hypothetical protein ACTSR8_12470 [Promethearchaeota archaeon]
MARKSGIIAGIFALLLTFLSQVPIYPPEELYLDLTLFSIDNIYYYYWGYTSGNKGTTLIKSPFPENLVALAIWLLILIIGILSIMGSTTKSNILKSSKIYKLNILLLVLLLFIYGFIVVVLIYPKFELIIITLNYGYYLTLLILILNIVALKSLRNKKEKE